MSEELAEIVDVNMPIDERGWTKLHNAAGAGKLRECKKLCENGADVNIKDKNGRAAIQLAANLGHLHVVKYLYENGQSYSWGFSE